MTEKKVKKISTILSLMLVLLLAVPTLADDFQRGIDEVRDGDYKKAARIFFPLAEDGHTQAQSFLGILYYRGKGVRRDYGWAAYWLSKAAEKGDGLAQNTLGYMYYRGHGFPRNNKKAVKWWRKAAKQDNADAQNKLGYMFSRGKGVKQDKKAAFVWYYVAEENEHEEASFNRMTIEKELNLFERSGAWLDARKCRRSRPAYDACP